MDDVQDSYRIDAQSKRLRHAENVKDRRRPGRIHNISPVLIPLLRNSTEGLVAGDLVPIDRSQIIAAWAASAYPADIWRRLSPTERSAAIYRELRKLDAVHAAREFDALAKLIAEEDC
jgi:hypothetical protein